MESPSETDFTVAAESATAGDRRRPERLRCEDPGRPRETASGSSARLDPPRSYCSTGTTGDEIAAAPGDLKPAPRRTYTPVGVEAQIPVLGDVEPDADGDGFGDETQDKCPQSKSIQVECPALVLDSVLTPGKTSISVYVAASVEAPVTVSGTVNVATPKKKAQKSATKKIKLTSTTQMVSPGKIGKFKLNYPAALLSALKSLPRASPRRRRSRSRAPTWRASKQPVSSTAKIKGQQKKK